MCQDPTLALRNAGRPRRFSVLVFPRRAADALPFEPSMRPGVRYGFEALNSTDADMKESDKQQLSSDVCMNVTLEHSLITSVGSIEKTA